MEEDIVERVPVENTIASDIFVVQQANAVYLMICQQDPSNGEMVLKQRIVMAPEDFWRCIRDKLSQFGGR